MTSFSKLALAVKSAVVIGAVAHTNASFAADSDRVQEVEKIQVTGSRIVKPKLSQPAPIVTIGAKDIAQAGVPDLGSVLAELPAIGSTDTLIGNNDSNEFAGVTSADLRRLGASRTLVLVNGKRHVAGAPGSAQVDLNTIPSALIERVEVITGGASAIYGSDAVSGVVNIILRDDYEGFEFNGSVGNSTEGVGTKNHSFSVTGGAEVFDGRGNVTFFAGKDRIAEVMANDIRQVQHYGSVANPEDTGETDGIPDRLTVPNVMSELISEHGVISADVNWTFDENGVPVQMPERVYSSNGAFGSFPDGCQYCFKTQDYENVYPDLDKTTVASSFSFDFTDNHAFYSDFKFVRSDIKQQFQPSFRFGNVSVNVQDNPYLDETLRQDLLSQGYETIGFSKFFGELGNRSASNKRELFRFVGGFEGLFTLSETDFSYDTYYVFGRTDNVRNTLNDLIPDNFVAALDSVIDPATGEAACRSQVASAQGDDYSDPASVNGGACAPYNPFGFNQASQAAKDWVSADVTRTDKITQEVIGGYISFDSAEFFELQGGPIGIATGFEYREETSQTITDEFAKAGFLTTAATPDAYGEYDVTEGFIEVSLPLLSGLSFAKELTLDAAYRSADYSHTGSSGSWKVGLLYQPIDDLRIRGTYGEAERAPNITEAFDPVSPGFQNISDPCDAANINDNPNRAANCAALGIPDGFVSQDAVSVDILSGGNIDLKPEQSTSLTTGIVWTPSFADNFSMTVDYYDIEIEDAIQFISAETVAENCVDAAGAPDSNFCAQVDRNPETNDIELIRSGYLNAAAIKTSGIEADFDYRTDLAAFDVDGELTFNLFVNHLLELEEFEFQNRPDTVDVEDGEVGDPQWQGRFTVQYSWQDLNLTWTTRYTDRSARFDVSPDGDIEEDISPSYVGSMVTHDLSARYQLTDNTRVDLGLRNLTDKLPPAYIQASGGDEAIYDVVGRRFFANVNVTF